MSRYEHNDLSIGDEAADEIEHLRAKRDGLLQAHTALVARLHDVTAMLEAERARIAGAPVVKRNQLRSGIVPGDYAVPWDWNPEGKRVALVVLNEVLP
jgi:hypothetical protein